MKKLLLLISFATIAQQANGQYYYPTGSSPYTQNFDGIASGLPTGWSTFLSSSSTSIGAPASPTLTPQPPYYLLTDTACSYDATEHGFKNFPSAASIPEWVDSCGAFNNCTNRALGVRQISSCSDGGCFDSGSAFVFQIANTNGMDNIAISFRLQSIDTSSPRETTWMVDYGLGATPTTFTPVATTGYMVTGGRKFFDTAVTATFPDAINSQSQPVTFRIVTLQFSSDAVGDGNRASTAIDSFQMTWTGNATTGVNEISAVPTVSLNVLGNATPSNITLGYSVSLEGAYHLAIYDLSGRILYTETVNATTGKQQLSVNGLNLAPGMYMAKLSNENSSTVAKIAVQ